MKLLLLLLTLTTICAAAQWTNVANLDPDLTRLTTSDTHLVAYTTEKVSSSTDGRNWSVPVDPGFPILVISQTPTDDFVALSFIEDPRSDNFGAPYNILIMDSTDGINWTQRLEIALFEGLALPATGEIAVTEAHFYLTVTTEQFGVSQDLSLFGDASRIERDPFNSKNIVALNGDIFRKGPVFSSRPCSFTNVLSDAELSSSSAYGQNLPGYLDIRTISDDLILGQNGMTRKDGQIYYGNWKDLGEIKGYHNGVGLTLTEPDTSPKLYLSQDFLRTWIEQALPAPQTNRHLDATFFKDQWFVLSDSDTTNTLYSLSVEPVTYQAQGQVQLKSESYHDRPFLIPGCKDNLTTSQGIELTFPAEADKLYQVYTSPDLENWTAYALPFPGATTHDFPIISDRFALRKVFFRAEEIAPTQE